MHNYIGKLKMQGARMSTTDMSLFQIKSIPYSIRNINSYSETKMQDLRQAPQLISFIRPADWMLFTSPRGINFRSLQNSLGSSVKTTVDKLNILRDVRTNEFMEIINKQYSNVSLELSNKLEVNSVVLLKNIAN